MSKKPLNRKHLTEAEMKHIIELYTDGGPTMTVTKIAEILNRSYGSVMKVIKLAGVPKLPKVIAGRGTYPRVKKQALSFFDKLNKVKQDMDPASPMQLSLASESKPANYNPGGGIQDMSVFYNYDPKNRPYFKDREPHFTYGDIYHAIQSTIYHYDSFMPQDEVRDTANNLYFKFMRSHNKKNTGDDDVTTTVLTTLPVVDGKIHNGDTREEQDGADALCQTVSRVL